MSGKIHVCVCPLQPNNNNLSYEFLMCTQSSCFFDFFFCCIVSYCEEFSNLKVQHGTVIPSAQSENYTVSLAKHSTTVENYSPSSQHATTTNSPYTVTGSQARQTTTSSEVGVIGSHGERLPGRNNMMRRRSLSEQQGSGTLFGNGTELSLICDRYYLGSQEKYARCEWDESKGDSIWVVDHTAQCVGMYQTAR